MSNEIYLNHPTLGLLYRVCLLAENRELFTTLYAQRLFFIVTTTPDDTIFESIGRSDAKLLVESRLREMRRVGIGQDYKNLYSSYQRTFQ